MQDWFPPQSQIWRVNVASVEETTAVGLWRLVSLAGGFLTSDLSAGVRKIESIEVRQLSPLPALLARGRFAEELGGEPIAKDLQISAMGREVEIFRKIEGHVSK
jgi:hypothetical protein